MIKKIDDKDLRKALELVNNVFSEFVAVDYAQEGKNTFENYLKNKYDEVSLDLESGHKKMWAYYQNGEIIGVISTRNISHISLMFVDKKHHKKGIARQMFHAVHEELRNNEAVRQITVNSSPYAVRVYEHLGFVKMGEQQEKDGIIFIPMIRPV